MYSSIPSGGRRDSCGPRRWPGSALCSGLTGRPIRGQTSIIFTKVRPHHPATLIDRKPAGARVLFSISPRPELSAAISNSVFPGHLEINAMIAHIRLADWHEPVHVIPAIGEVGDVRSIILPGV